MTLLLAGGGTPAQERLVWGEAFGGATRVLYWPFALPAGQIPTSGFWLQEALEDLAMAVHVDTWEHLEGHHEEELMAYDVLFVGGGKTSKLAQHVHDHEFTGAVRDFVAGGGTYLGGSAGALFVCEQITLASLVDDDLQAAGMSGLGMVQRVSLFPHADQFPPARPLDVARCLGHDVLALPEASGVAVDDHVVRAIGPESVRLVFTAEGTIRTLDPGESVALAW